MWAGAGRTFIYMVHDNWLLNIVTEKKGIPAAVLIRSLEPAAELELMKRHRNAKKSKISGAPKTKSFQGKDGYDMTNGPGKLTHALKIGKRNNDIEVYDFYSDINIIKLPVKQNFKVAKSNRIGVKYDLKKKLRFYIKDNKWVSKGKIYGELMPKK